MSIVPVMNRNVLLQDQKPHISVEEFHRLVEAAMDQHDSLKRKSSRNEFIRDRNIMLMELMWVTGARVGDVVKFRYDSIDTYNHRIKFWVQKRKHYHTIPIEPDIILHVQNYVNKWKIQGCLFTPFQDIHKPSEQQTTISVDTVQLMLKKYSVEMGRNIHPHLFRHGMAVYLVQRGVPLDVVAFYLDHSSVSTTTNFYARITPDIARNIIKEKVSNLLG